MSMKRLLLVALILTASPLQAQVDPKVAAQCKDARDFFGCVKAFSVPAAAPDDGLQALRNAMKQVASRLAAGTSLRDSTETFRPVVDQLSIVESQYPKSLAVKNARLASNLFDALQTAWGARIKAENYQLNQYGGDKVYNCKILKLSADNFDQVYGSSVINWTYTKGAFGWTSCKVPYGRLPEDYMRPIVNRVLREGAISPEEIAAKKKAEAERQLKIQREKELCALGPWNRYLEENPGMKAWAAANPGPAENQKKKFMADPKNQGSCNGSNFSGRRDFEWFYAHPISEENSTQAYVCNTASNCIRREDYRPR